MSAPRPLGSWVYRALLLAYPREFRDAHGREATETFVLLLGETSGLGPRINLWMRTIRSVVIDGMRERGFGSPRSRPSAGRWMAAAGRLRQSVRNGLRQWVRSPVHAVVATVSLAVGIGVAVAVLNVMLTLFVRPAVPGASSSLGVVGVWRDGNIQWSMAPGQVDRLSQRTRSFVALAGERFGWAWVTGVGPSLELEGSLVTFNYFDVLGLTPAIGRVFHEQDRASTATHSVAIISHRLWTDHFGAAVSVLGQTIEVNGQPVEILGVAPRGFRGPFQAQARDIWIPHELGHLTGQGAAGTLFRSGGTFEVIGRRGKGVSRIQAEEELLGLIRDGGPAEVISGVVVQHVRGVHPEQRSDLAETGRVALGIAGVLLTLTCINLGGLLYSRHLSRYKELSVRCALGGTRRGLVAELCAENLVVAVAAAGVSLVAAAAGQRLVANWFAYGFPGLHLPLTPTVAGLAMGLSVMVVLAFTIIPALLSTRSAPLAGLNERRPSSEGYRHTSRMQAGIAAAQVALSLMLVTGAAVMAASVSATLSVGGSDSDSILHYRLRPSRAGYTPQASLDYFAGLLADLDRVELVETAGLARVGVGRDWCCPLAVAYADQPGAVIRKVENNSVTAGFFDMLHIPLEAGRLFDATDTPASPPVAIVNRALADLLWPSASAVGQRLRTGEDDDVEVVQVVGVVATTHPSRSAEDPVPYLYLNFWQTKSVDGRLFVRVRGATGPAGRRLQAVLTGAGSGVHIGQVGTLADRIALGLAPQLALSGVLRASAGAGVVLSALGVYSLLSVSVRRRRRDDAIRLALGASRGAIVIGVLATGVRILGPGIALGVGLAWMQSRLLSGYIFGIQALDPMILGGATLAILIVGLLALGLPARRAAAVQPADVLRG